MDCGCQSPSVGELGRYTATINGVTKTFVEKYCSNCKAQWSEEV